MDNFVEIFNTLATNLKIIFLDYQNNYIEILSMMLQNFLYF